MVCVYCVLQFVAAAVLVAFAYLTYLVYYPLFVAKRLKKQFGDDIIVFFKPIVGVQRFGQESLAESNNEYSKLIALARQNPKAKAIVSNIFFQPYLLIIDPQWIGSLALQILDQYEHIPGSLMFKVLTPNRKRDMTKEVHGYTRKAMATFFQFEKLKDATNSIIKLNIEQQLSKLDDQGVELKDQIQAVTSGVTSDTFLGLDEIKNVKMKNGLALPIELVTLFQESAQFMRSQPVYYLKMLLFRYRAPDVFPSAKEKEIMARVYDVRAVIAKYINGLYEDYKKNGSRGDKYLIDTLFKHLREDDQPVTQDKFIDIESIIMRYQGLYFAGTDTTAGLSTTGLLLLGAYPRVQDKVRAELAAKVKSFADLKHEDMNQLTYLYYFMKEALRLYSPAPTNAMRSAVKPHTIGDNLKVEKGWLVSACPIINHLNEQYFDAPEDFRPERWETLKEQAFTFLPFWAGPRNCLGQHLAMIESRMIWVYVILNYRVELNCDFKDIVWRQRSVFDGYDEGKQLLKFHRL